MTTVGVVGRELLGHHLVELLIAQIDARGDVDEDAARAGQVDVLEQRARDGRLGRDARAVRAGRDRRAHHRHADLAHHRAHVGEVDVDEAGHV